MNSKLYKITVDCRCNTISGNVNKNRENSKFCGCTKLQILLWFPENTFNYFKFNVNYMNPLIHNNRSMKTNLLLHQTNPAN